MPLALMLRRCSPISRASGFTLIELMVVVAIVTIMAAFATPDLQLFLRTATVRSVTTEFASVLNYARSEAIKRGRPVSVCKTASIQTNPLICSTTATWNSGWIAFIDIDRDGVIDISDSPVRVGQPTTNRIMISTNGNFTNYINYLPTGSSSGNGTISLQMQGIQRNIVVIATGRLRIDSGNSL